MNTHLQQPVRKGSIIEETQYGTTITSEIITDVNVLHIGKPRTCQQEFKAKIIKVNGKPQPNGNIIDYLIGGTYGSKISVVEY